MKGRKGDKANNWKGGRVVGSKHIIVYKPNHPFASTRDGYILEHRLIIEKHLGRYLLPTEHVHHINKNPIDNRLKNLYLFATNSDHTTYHQHVKYRKLKPITKSNLF